MSKSKVEIWGMGDCPECRRYFAALGSLGYPVEEHYWEKEEIDSLKRCDLMSAIQWAEGKMPVFFYNGRAYTPDEFSGFAGGLI